jgi:hypothetical protein
VALAWWQTFVGRGAPAIVLAVAGQLRTYVQVLKLSAARRTGDFFLGSQLTSQKSSESRIRIKNQESTGYLGWATACSPRLNVRQTSSTPSVPSLNVTVRPGLGLGSL